MAVLLAFLISSKAQQTTLPQPNASHPSQPAASSNGPGTVGSEMPSATGSATNTSVAPSGAVNSTGSNSTAAEDNPYDPLLEPPPLPKGKATLIGGIATSVDHVRNHLTVQPFGKGTKVKVFVDERSHIYRNGVETTVLGIHKGDRVYVDTMLDGSKVFAKTVRVITETGLAEVRGQVIGSNPEKGTISVRVVKKAISARRTRRQRSSACHRARWPAADFVRARAGNVVDAYRKWTQASITRPRPASPSPASFSIFGNRTEPRPGPSRRTLPAKSSATARSPSKTPGRE